MNRTLMACIASVFGIGVVPPSMAKYPEKPIAIVVPFTAGGFSDKVARLVADGLSKRLGVATIVENKPGAAGSVALSYMSRANPDGYTLYLSNSATDAINPVIYRRMEVDPQKILEPVALVVKTPNLVAVNNDVKAKNVKELVAAAKENPGKYYFGTPGVGTTGHLTGELFNRTAGVKLEHVPYKGSAQVFTDLVGGQVQVTFDNITTLASQAAAGKIRGLAVTGLKRSPLMPDMPTMEEAGFPGFETTSWAGISTPTGTSRNIVDVLNKAINETINTDEFKQKMNGGEVVGGTANEFGAFITAERKKWGDVARDINFSVD